MGFLDGAKEFFRKKPTPQEQQVNTGGVMEPFAPLTSQVPQASAEARAPIVPNPEPTTVALPNVGEVTPVADVTLSPDQTAPLPQTNPPSDQQAA